MHRRVDGAVHRDARLPSPIAFPASDVGYAWRGGRHAFVPTASALLAVPRRGGRGARMRAHLWTSIRPQAPDAATADLARVAEITPPCSRNTTLIPRRPPWTAVIARDRSADGTFFYSVRTTASTVGRPARRDARTRRRRFHATAADAERAGSVPADAAARLLSIDAACRNDRTHRREIDAAEGRRCSRTCPDAGLSPYHFHRIFKSVTGITPRAYAAAQRATACASPRQRRDCDERDLRTQDQLRRDASMSLTCDPRHQPRTTRQARGHRIRSRRDARSDVLSRRARRHLRDPARDDPGRWSETSGSVSAGHARPGDRGFERPSRRWWRQSKHRRLFSIFRSTSRTLPGAVLACAQDIPPGHRPSQTWRGVSVTPSPAPSRGPAGHPVAVAIPCTASFAPTAASRLSLGIERKRELLAAKAAAELVWRSGGVTPRTHRLCPCKTLDRTLSASLSAPSAKQNAPSA